MIIIYFRWTILYHNIVEYNYHFIKKKICMNNVLLFDMGGLIFKNYGKNFSRRIITEIEKKFVEKFVESVLNDIFFYYGILNPKVILVLGEGHSWRKDIYEEYKSNRKNKYEEYNFEFIEIVKDRIIEEFGKLSILYLKHDNLEADDLISFFSRYYFDLGYNSIIMSNDADYYQVLDYNEERKNYIFSLSFRAETEELVSSRKMVIFDNEIKRFFVKGDDLELSSFSRNGKKKYNMYLVGKRGFIDLLLGEYESSQDPFKVKISSIDGRDNILSILYNNNIYLLEVDPNKRLIEKIFCGDKSDNIPSVLVNSVDKYKRGNKHIINKKDFQSIYQFISNIYKDISIDLLVENKNNILIEILNLIEKKKGIQIKFDEFLKNLKFSYKLVSFKEIPENYMRDVLNFIKSINLESFRIDKNTFTEYIKEFYNKKYSLSV